MTTPGSRSLGELLECWAWRAEAFGRLAEYIAHAKARLPACLILDVELPDINGLEFQKQVGRGDHPPIVFITGHGDIPSYGARHQGRRGGFSDQAVQPRHALLEAIQAAIDRTASGVPNAQSRRGCASGWRPLRRGSARCCRWWSAAS